MGKFRHIAIQVPDLEKAAAFYEGVFGLKRLKKVDAPIGNAISLSDGVMNLTLLHFPEGTTGGKGVISRPDLADRAMFVTLDPIAEQRRRSEKDLWREFELKQPGILGAILDVASSGLKSFPDVNIERWPRMADFAQWGTACEGVFGSPGTFLRAYRKNRRSAREQVLDADPVAVRVREIMAHRSAWSGSASDLLSAGVGVGEFFRGRDDWPNDPRALAGRLRRTQPGLRALGIEIAFSREGHSGRRMIRIRWTRSVPASAMLAG